MLNRKSVPNRKERLKARERLVEDLAKRRNISKEEVQKRFDEFLAEVRSAQWIELHGNINISLPDKTMIVIVQNSQGRYSVSVLYDRMLCMNHNVPAVWVRSTQFSGQHYFCDECARKEKDFGKLVDDCFWKKV